MKLNDLGEETLPPIVERREGKPISKVPVETAGILDE
jgi:hypothetical protein